MDKYLFITHMIKNIKVQGGIQGVKIQVKERVEEKKRNTDYSIIWIGG